jgi:GTPase
VLAEDMPFATLDPTLRRVRLPHSETVILSDTVGFISELPTTLVAAFRATLEEVVEADVILHVRDVASPEFQEQAADVTTVLGELGIEPSDRRLLEVWTKIDRLAPDEREAVKARAAGQGAVAVSALTGEGLDDLLAALEKRLTEDRPTMTVGLTAAQLGAAPWLYENAEILAREDDSATGDARLTVRLSEKRLGAFHDWARESGAAVTAREAEAG